MFYPLYFSNKQHRIHLNRRPLFLQRNIRRFKTRHSQQQLAKQIAVTGQHQPPPTTTSTLAGRDATATAAASTTADAAAAEPQSTASTNNNHHSPPTHHSNESPAAASWTTAARRPERLGAGALDAGRGAYAIDDGAEMKLNMQSYRMVFVMNKDVLFYKHNSLAQSRKVSGIAAALLPPHLRSELCLKR